MKNRFSFILLILAILAASIALTACTGGDDTTDTTTSDAPTSGAVTSTEAPVTENPLLVTAYDHPEAFVTLPDLKDIQVKNSAVKKLVDDYITSVLAQLGRTDYRVMADDTPAIKGDSVNIHYTGRAKDENTNISETTMAGMTNADDAAGYDLVLGSGSFIPGFEDQLIGAKKGDKVVVDVIFPDDYHSEELQGVAVLFDVTVNSVKRASISETSLVTLTVAYTLDNGITANGDIASFLEEHTAKITMNKLTEAFDECFDAAIIAEAITGKTIYESVTVKLTLTKEQAEEFGYDTELSLTATMTVEDIFIYPEALTDDDVKTYTGGEYTTVESFNAYIYDYYKVNEAYNAIVAAIKYAEIPADVYKALYDNYYEASLYQQLGDISSLTEEELAAKLTDAVKKTADEFATENATAEWKDRMMMSYLQKKVGYTLTEEVYKQELDEIYNYYLNNQYYMLLYYGISSKEQFEAFIGRDSLEFQFINDAVLTLVAKEVTYVD